MDKIKKSPAPVLFPVPPVLVSSADQEGKGNIFTCAWTGTLCSEPPMLYVSIRPGRYSYELIEQSGEFVVNLPTKDMAYAVDYCGTYSGRDIDKFQKMKLTPQPSDIVKAPSIKECPVTIECKLDKIIKLGTHDMFIANIVLVSVDEAYVDEQGEVDYSAMNLLTYAGKDYCTLTQPVAKRGVSVERK